MQTIIGGLVIAAIGGISFIAYHHHQEYARYYKYAFATLTLFALSVFAWNAITFITINLAVQEVTLTLKEVIPEEVIHVDESTVTNIPDIISKNQESRAIISKTREKLWEVSHSLWVPITWILIIYFLLISYLVFLLYFPQLFKKSRREL